MNKIAINQCLVLLTALPVAFFLMKQTLATTSMWMVCSYAWSLVAAIVSYTVLEKYFLTLPWSESHPFLSTGILFLCLFSATFGTHSFISALESSANILTAFKDATAPIGFFLTMAVFAIPALVIVTLAFGYFLKNSPASITDINLLSFIYIFLGLAVGLLFSELVSSQWDWSSFLSKTLIVVGLIVGVAGAFAAFRNQDLRTLSNGALVGLLILGTIWQLIAWDRVPSSLTRDSIVRAIHSDSKEVSATEQVSISSISDFQFGTSGGTSLGNLLPDSLRQLNRSARNGENGKGKSYLFNSQAFELSPGNYFVTLNREGRWLNFYNVKSTETIEAFRSQTLTKEEELGQRPIELPAMN
jgi:hypothetical protein